MKTHFSRLLAGKLPYVTQHAKPDGIIQGWLSYYAARTPGTEYVPNATVRLDANDVPQPDALLRLLPECGGCTHIDASGYLCGPPKLVVEIAASSVSIDLHEQLRQSAGTRRGG